MIRLRRHRGNLSSTLSSSGSSFTARRFIKLFILCILFLVINLPFNLAFCYFNIKNFLPLQTYSWSRVHDPKVWYLVIYFTAKDYPIQQYYGWSPIILGLCIFFFYGLNNEAVDRYRSILLNFGLGRIWPSLTQPRESQRRNSTTSANWLIKLDIVGKLVRYYDNVRKHSHVSTTAASDA